jgi:PRTRC genetic system ThiF family protein
MRKYTHTVPSYFVHPDHPITIILVGLGGTGSLLLTRLAKINTALLALGHKGIHVAAFDGDKVSKANEGRSNFFSADVGRNKATVLIERVNRACGFAWTAIPSMFPVGAKRTSANIVISCVDSVKSRRQIYNHLRTHHRLMNGNLDYTDQIAYWMDLGNTQSTGQVILGTMGYHSQPKNSESDIHYLPNVFDLYPRLEDHEEPDAPSCSMAEALAKQDLFINDILAGWAGDLIWDMFRKIRLSTVGVYVNLDNKTTNGLPIQVPNMKWFNKKNKMPKLKPKKGLSALLDDEGNLPEEGVIMDEVDIDI